MRARADEFAPGVHLGDWTSNRAFFKCARLDEWRDVLTAENQTLYEELAPQRVPPPLRAWLEGGRGGRGPEVGGAARPAVSSSADTKGQFQPSGGEATLGPAGCGLCRSLG